VQGGRREGHRHQRGRCGGDASTETAWKDIAVEIRGQYTSIAAERRGAGGHDAAPTRGWRSCPGKLVGTGVYYGDGAPAGPGGLAQRKALAEA